MWKYNRFQFAVFSARTSMLKLHESIDEQGLNLLLNTKWNIDLLEEKTCRNFHRGLKSLTRRVSLQLLWNKR